MNKRMIEEELEKRNAPKPPSISYHAAPASVRGDFITGKTMARTVSSIDKEKNNPPTGAVETIEEDSAEEAEPIEAAEDASLTASDLDDVQEGSLSNQNEEDSSGIEDLVEVSNNTPINIYDTISAPALKAALKSRLAKKCPPHEAKCSTELYEMSKHLVDMLPSKFNSKSNKMLGGADTKKKLAWCNTHFPAGKTCFEVPQDSCLEEPFMPYGSIVGTKLCMLRWESQDPNIFLGCTKVGCCGELIHDRFDLIKNGQMTPIICTESRPSWVISMKYCCAECGDSCYAHEGRLLNTLPKWMHSSISY